VTAVFGVFLLSSGVQGWFIGGRAVWYSATVLILAALFMIEGGWVSDLIGIGIALGGISFAIQRFLKPDPTATITVRGAD
jgi:TRAP-type uncharacterized transport system fused permease subunit